jgi:hypothetical protein
VRGSSGRPDPGCIIRSIVASPARVPGGLGRGDARFSGRTDNPGRAGPGTAAAFRGLGFTSLYAHNEGGIIHEGTEAADLGQSVRGYGVERTASRVEDLLSERGGGGGVRT